MTTVGVANLFTTIIAGGFALIIIIGVIWLAVASIGCIRDTIFEQREKSRKRREEELEREKRQATLFAESRLEWLERNRR